MDIDDTATIWTGQPLAQDVPLLVVMHGFGANERDLVPLVQKLPASFAAACVRAPLPIAQLPGSFAWFPIGNDPGVPALAIADEAVAALERWLRAVTSRVQVGPIVLLGFSQGGAMVTHLLRHFPNRFTAGVVLSGFVVPGAVATDPDLAAARPPLFLGYDPRDPIVPEAAFTRTVEFASEHLELTVRTYPVGHGISEAELRDVHAFLTAVLS